MVELDIHRVMGELAARRPIFHSEADFQFALAWQIAEMWPDCEVRLEKPFSLCGKRMHLDIWLSTSSTAIELKYPTQSLRAEQQGEEFALRPHGAQDHGRYDFIADIVRIEGLVSQGCASAPGYAVLLTNDHLYWQPGKDDAADKAFHLHEGRNLRGELAWSENASKGTTKGRESPLVLRESYDLQWKCFSALPGTHGEFRYFVVRVEERSRATAPHRCRPRIAVTPMAATTSETTAAT